MARRSPERRPLIQPAAVVPPAPGDIEPAPAQETAPAVATQGEPAASAAPSPGPTGAKTADVIAPFAPPPALTNDQRRRAIDRYLREILRPRIHRHFVYSEQARSLELEGTVLLRLSLDASGRLRGVALVGDCLHPLLCRFAQETILAAAPFPAPPAVLGEIVVDAPLTYRLD